jgi:DNA-binding LacI/PurR family transcriptional regulator
MRGEALGGIVDGMLVGTEVLSADANLAGRLLASEIPALLLSTAPVEGLPALNTDFSSGIAKAVATLVERGHSRIASVCASERHGRWKSVPCEVQCAKFGVEHIAFQYPPEGEKTCASPELCERIIAARPDALIMENARMSLNTLDMLARARLHAFQGFFGRLHRRRTMDRLCHVPLAVVDYNCAVHARQAVETLVSMLAGARPAPFQQTKTFLRRAEFIAYRNKSKETI